MFMPRHSCTEMNSVQAPAGIYLHKDMWLEKAGFSLAACERALEELPHNAFLQYLMGEFNYEKQSWEQAITHYKEALRRLEEKGAVGASPSAEVRPKLAGDKVSMADDVIIKFPKA